MLGDDFLTGNSDVHDANGAEGDEVFGDTCHAETEAACEP